MVPPRRSRWQHWLLFALVMALGTAARTWKFGRIPPGLNVDEASIGVDAYSVLKFGIDRNGITYPTQFIAFGQEQNALYAYLLMPLLAIFGLRISILRLPMLIYGLLSLPLLYTIIRRHFNERLALLSAFFLAISPWHVMISRWALDQNMLPFVFLLGFGALLETGRDDRWYIAACFFMALSLYVYGPTYFIVPCVMLVATAILLRRKCLRRNLLVAGLAVFLAMATPVALFLTINALGLDPIHIGAVTIPRLPTSLPRFLSGINEYSNDPVQTLQVNINRLASVVILQTDGLVYNVVEPFGYFYGVTFPVAVLGSYSLFQRMKFHRHVGSALMLLWIVACLVFGIFQYVSINRLNTVFIPLIVSIAVGVEWLSRKAQWVLPLSVTLLLLGFTAFNIAYHGPAYAKEASSKFRPGLVQAIRFASLKSDGPICVTDEPGQAYIFVLFSEKLDPRSYLDHIKLADSPGPQRFVAALGRYTFGKSGCALKPLPVYVLIQGEIPPQLGKKYTAEFFDKYVVYYPRP